MKVAFTGKGGVGKTTLASLLIKSFSKDDEEVLAVDCDPDSNLARALGFKDAGKIKPIAHMKDVIDERMGITPGNRSFFKLNPRIDDIPDKFSKESGKIKLIVMGSVKEGGSGCMCPESAFIKNLLGHLILKRNEHVVMDMEAGVEHLGRGTAESCDFVLVVCDPSLNSIGTAKKIHGFANEIGVKKIYALGNKIRGKKDEEFIKKELKGIKLIGTVKFNENFLESDKEKGFSIDFDDLYRTMESVKKFLKEDLE